MRDMICACMSVGKPGKGCVVTSTPRRAQERRASTPSVVGSISMPIWRILAITASSSSKGQSVSSNSPSVIPAAARRVPASMRSGMMR